MPSDAPACRASSLAVFGPGGDRSPEIVLARARHLVEGADPSSAVAETPSGELLGLAITRRLGPIVLLAWAVVAEATRSGHHASAPARLPHRRAGRAAHRALLDGPEGGAPLRLLGLALHPTVSAAASCDRAPVADAPGTRECSAREAAPILDALALEARGAAYGRDVDLLEGQGDRVHLCGDDAAVVRAGGVIRLAVARDERAAALALRAALLAVPPGATVHLNQLRGGMDWAIHEAVAAGLSFSPEGPVFSDQPLSPLHLPQGSLC